MQKHAFSDKNRYNTLYEPLPAQSDTPIFFDRETVTLSYFEDFPYLHYHDRFEIGICEWGEGLFISADGYSPFKEGDLIFVSPRTKHYSRSLSAEQLCRCRFAYVKEETVKERLLCDESVGFDNIGLQIPTIIRNSEHPSAAALLKEMLECCYEKLPHGESLVALRLATFLLECDRWFPPSDSARGLSASDDKNSGASKIAPAAEYIAIHYNEQTSSAYLAALCHLSESQLRRNFMLAYGTTPTAYRNSLRISIGQQLLLRTEMSVSDVAERLGFPSASDFCRMFKKHSGSSPSEYKRSIQD